MALSAKHRAFVNEYLQCFNKTEAYQRVYATKSRDSARSNGARLFANDSIQEAIREALDESAMLAEEVLMRLAEQGRATMADFVDPHSDDGYQFSLFETDKETGERKPKEALRLLKGLEQRRTTRTDEDGNTTTVVETKLTLHDAQAAQRLIGQNHGLFKSVTEHTGKDGGPIAHEHSGVNIYIPDNGRDESNGD